MHRSRKSAIAPGIGQLALIATTTAVLTATTAIGPLVSVASANEQTINISRMGAGVSRDVKLGLNKAVVVDLPADAHDILVADPSVADAVTRSSRRIYIFGKAVGQTNIFVFGASGAPIVSLDLAVERDITGLKKQLARFIPDSDINVEIISDNIVLTGSVRTPQDASRGKPACRHLPQGVVKPRREISRPSAMAVMQQSLPNSGRCRRSSTCWTSRARTR